MEYAAGKDPQLIVCVLTHPKADIYSLIKKKCCLEYGKPSQVLVRNTIRPKPGKNTASLMSVGTKVAIQINSKLGGVPWMVDIPLNGLMMIGFDVCHDTKDRNRKSYGAMVATMDQRKKQNFFSAVSAHVEGVELSNNFVLNIRQAFTEYQKEHGTLPENILIYRDGVGEGQTEYVKKHEVKSILGALSNVYGEKKVPLTFVVVTKRINTRFFSINRGKYENPVPGTIVDDVVTLPER